MPIISEGLKKLAVVGMMGCSGMALLVFVQHGQRDGYPMEVPKVAVVFLEKITPKKAKNSRMMLLF